jgi:hypothetical protein
MVTILIALFRNFNTKIHAGYAGFSLRLLPDSLPA